QQGPWGWQVARPASMAHPLAPPQMGHCAGLTMATGCMQVVFCDMSAMAAWQECFLGLTGETDMTRNQPLTAAQLKELKDLLRARRRDLEEQMEQNRANLAPAE